MLFDFQGKRRRLIQVVFTFLALLFIVGFVGFGVGSNISGDQGLSGIFGQGSGNGNGSNKLLDRRISRLEGQARANPNSATVRAALTRSYFQRAAQKADENGRYPADAKKDLRAADRNWQAYLKAAGDKPSADVVGLALQIYVPGALNNTQEAKETAQLLAERQPSAQAYLNLVQYASADKDKRTADLAGQKVLDLTPKSQQKQVKKSIAQAKAQAAAAQAQPQTQQGLTQ